MSLGAVGQRSRSLVGETLDNKYRVLALIGEGGMGTVYEAEHIQLGRRVAIKALNREHLERKEAVVRFFQEARLVGTISHPNTCEIFDLGTLESGAPYLVMERLTGNTLAERIEAEGPVAFDEAVVIIIQVLSALDSAHGKGVIHRDIKPGNIFLTERVGCPPMVKVLDFGISKDTDSDGLDLTRTGMVMGTPYYMAPEQIRGESIDHRVDIHACGVVLYEALTGQRPYVGPNYKALVFQILTNMPRDPRELRPQLPNSLVHVMETALAKQRENRFVDAKSFIRALNDVQGDLLRLATGSDISKMASQVGGFHSSSEPPPSDSIEILLDFSDSGVAAQVSLETGEIEVDLSTGPQSSDADAVRAKQDSGELSESDESDIHDTIVDTGALREEFIVQLEKMRARRSSRTAPSAEGGGPLPVVERTRHDRGRYSLVSVSDEDGAKVQRAVPRPKTPPAQRVSAADRTENAEERQTIPAPKGSSEKKMTAEKLQ